MQLARVILRVGSPKALARFYVEHLGMALIEPGPPLVLGYGGGDASIELQAAGTDETYRHRPEDRYWKIGITLPDVDIAHAQLVKAGVQVSAPRQFEKIGYMAHLQDPEGFQIELLQHRFGAPRAQGAGDREKPLGGGARIGQITLRTNDLEAALGFYGDRLGMTLLSIQPVPDYGFTLYFLAFTEERPPDAGLEAVSNREWLWQRPYTTLELQHFGEAAGAHGAFALPAEDEPGFAGLVIKDADAAAAHLLDDGGGVVDILR